MKMEILTVQNQYDVTKGQYDMFVVLLNLFTLAQKRFVHTPLSNGKEFLSRIFSSTPAISPHFELWPF